MVRFRIEFVKSIIGRKFNYIVIVKLLGFKKMYDVVEYNEIFELKGKLV